MKPNSPQETTRRYYEEKGRNRNSLLLNAGVPFQVFAAEAAVIRALRRCVSDPSECRLLDVGCGNGAGLLNFLRFGFLAPKLHGIDLQKDRVAESRDRLPACQIVHGDATAMPYPDGFFDIVFESTMFVELPDDDLASRISREMMRVCRHGGHIVLSDWRYSKPGDTHHRSMSRSRIFRLFHVGKECDWVTQERGSLLPPIGRVLSHYARWAYFLIHALCPPLAGQVVTVLRKTSPAG